MWKKLLTFSVIMVALSVYASTALFQAVYVVKGIDTLDTNSWRVIGDVIDSSPLGYGPSDVGTNYIVYCWTEYGDVDEYKITNIYARSNLSLTCDVVYDQEGTPRAGAPTPGNQIICDSSTLPSITYGVHESLQNGARNLKEMSLTNLASDASTWSSHYATNLVGWRIGTNTPLGIWSETNGLPAGTWGPACVTWSNNIYSIAGTVGTNVYKFDGATWTQVRGLPAGRDRLGAVAYSNAIYAIGGESGNAKTNVYAFDGTNWTEVSGLPQASVGIGVSEFQGKIYSFGNQGTTNVYAFDGTSWYQVMGLPSGRGNIVALTLNDRLYSIGGDTGGGTAATTNVWAFDGTNWTAVAGLPMPYKYHAGTVMNGKIYIAAGCNLVGATTNVYSFDGSTWTAEECLPVGMYGHGVAGLGNTIYTISSVGAGGVTNVYASSIQTNYIDYKIGATNDKFIIQRYGANLVEINHSNMLVKVPVTHGETEQVLSQGTNIVPNGNIRISTTNSTITLGNPQIETNGIVAGTIIYLNAASTTGSIRLTNGNGVVTDCSLGFLLGSNDIMQLMFIDGNWVETKRVDR